MRARPTRSLAALPSSRTSSISWVASPLVTTLPIAFLNSRRRIPSGAQWTQKSATLPVALAYIPAAAIGDLIYTAGGSTFAPCNLTETTNSFVYDPEKDSISLIASIPRATGETQAVNVGNEMWVLGGGRTAPIPSSEVNIYDPSTGEWRVGSPLSVGQRNFAMASDGTRVFVAGGYDPTMTPLKTAQVLGNTARP